MCMPYSEECARLMEASEQAIKLELGLIVRFKRAQIRDDAKAAKRFSIELNGAKAATDEALRAYRTHHLPAESKLFRAGGSCFIAEVKTEESLCSHHPGNPGVYCGQGSRETRR